MYCFDCLQALYRSHRKKGGGNKEKCIKANNIFQLNTTSNYYLNIQCRHLHFLDFISNSEFDSFAVCCSLKYTFCDAETFFFFKASLLY